MRKKPYCRGQHRGARRCCGRRAKHSGKPGTQRRIPARYCARRRWRRVVHRPAPGHTRLAGPKTGKTCHIPLCQGSAPHGVIIGPDSAAWIPGSGLNAIVRVVPRVDNKPKKVEVFPLPQGTPNINLNTVTFDNTGTLWFTGQNGYYGRLNPKTRITKTFETPRGRGPYGICTAPDESVYYVSLAGNHFIFHSLSTDTELMLFAFRFLRQTMFGEETIIMKTDALDKHPARKRERDAAKGETPGK